jgi:hypothetical protein
MIETAMKKQNNFVSVKSDSETLSGERYVTVRMVGQQVSQVEGRNNR